MEKWQELLAKLEVLSYRDTISKEQLQYIEEELGFSEEKLYCSEEELRHAEAKTGIVFPLEYKRFCQVFGTGMFGEFINICCPTDDWIEFSQEQVEALRSELRLRLPEQSRIMSIESILALLDAAFVFGSGDGDHVALWDLRTYSELDLSYDIYWMTTDDFDGHIYCVGRDFFEFVRDFCLGNKAYEILPPSMHLLEGVINPTFVRGG